MGRRIGTETGISMHNVIFDGGYRSPSGRVVSTARGARSELSSAVGGGAGCHVAALGVDGTPAFVTCPCPCTAVRACKHSVCECFECSHSQTLCLHVEHSQTLCLHVRTGDVTLSTVPDGCCHPSVEFIDFRTGSPDDRWNSLISTSLSQLSVP